MNVLRGKSSPALDVVLLNAGAAIKVSGKVNSLWDGVQLARESIQSGAALEKLNKVKKFTNQVKPEQV
jgi:anthranilate phosphoribosyltransferase